MWSNTSPRSNAPARSAIPVKTPSRSRPRRRSGHSGRRVDDRDEAARPLRAARSRSVERVRAGMPLWGTCMGMIVAAHDVAGLEQPTLDLIDITVRRNAFGRQNESAEVDLPIPALGETPFPGDFHSRAVDRTRRSRRSNCSPSERARRDGSPGQRARHVVPSGTDRRSAGPRVLPENRRRREEANVGKTSSAA